MLTEPFPDLNFGGFKGEIATARIKSNASNLAKFFASYGLQVDILQDNSVIGRFYKYS